MYATSFINERKVTINKMKKRVIFLLAVGFLFIPSTSNAYDINYANLERVAGDVALLKYRTTTGYTFAVCSIEDGKCGDLLYGENMDNNAPNLFPTIINQTNYTKSPDGRLAVINMASMGGLTYRALYRIDGDEARYVTLLPHYDSAQRVSVTYAGDAVIFLGNNGVVTRYDINTRDITSVNTGRSSFPFWSISEHGNYVSSYNHSAKTQDIWSVGGGLVSSIPAENPSYSVFSDNEKSVAYLNEVDGFNKLFVANINDANSGRDVASGNYTVVEYEFIGNTLYYIANTEENPYLWNLYSYELGSRKSQVVEKDVAYDDSYANLKKTNDTIFYEKVDGRNKDVVALRPGSNNSRVVLSAVSPSAATEDIDREYVVIDGVPGALLSPSDVRSSDELPLIVWLHGGPMRQTSVGFHPFFGYAVYDEILERLATEAYVLKIDYTGSWGHGNELREALVGNIGNLDVQDVFTAIDGIKDDKNIREVYLIGNSYGGYLSLRSLVENPDDIDAVVSIAGVTDWETLISRIPSSPFSNSFYGSPNAANANLYSTASIVNSLNGVGDQEMLIVYGDQDDSVPTWQSTEFTATATTVGKNVDLVRYEGEGHTIIKKNNLIDLCERTAAVFSLSSSICRE